jgi:hypothetical protein
LDSRFEDKLPVNTDLINHFQKIRSVFSLCLGQVIILMNI